MPGMNEIIEGIIRRVNFHRTRHEEDGADEVSIEGLSGTPAVINNIVSFEDTVVLHEDNVVTN